MRWLRAHVDGRGTVRSQKTSLRVIWGQGELAELGKGELALHTEAPEVLSEHFNMETYRQHLQSQRLGHTLLYADVTPTTMDLLEGYVHHPANDFNRVKGNCCSVAPPCTHVGFPLGSLVSSDLPKPCQRANWLL